MHESISLGPATKTMKPGNMKTAPMSPSMIAAPTRRHHPAYRIAG
jgi:hypothetical protein